jgi:hypothetical protein
MAYDDRDGLHGVGGWLAFFLFGFAFVSPLGLVIGTYFSLYGDPDVAAILGGRWELYQAAVWVEVALSLAMIGYVTWRLFNRHNWLTVKITIAAIGQVGLGLRLLDIALAVLIAEVELRILLAQIGPDLIKGLIYAAIWIAYFLRSVRIRNTYDLSREDESAGIFD